jgi:hypothetical protein
MQHFYDGQIRRYITQTIRVFSGFVVKYGDGTLRRVPVMYGDADRQVASIVRNNSENVVNSTPKIAVYVTGLDMDTDRLSDASFISKVQIRERGTYTDIGGNEVYTEAQGRNYTVERLMPTPYKLTMKVDIWSSNTDQKLQILEQILVLFNPSLELQTNSNFIDWTSLSVLNLTQLTWSSRQVPVGVDSPIDIATMTLTTPIWISPPAKVKHMGVITRIITSLYDSGSLDNSTYLDGFGPDLSNAGADLGSLMSTDTTTVGGFNIQVYNDEVHLLPSTSYQANGIEISIPSNTTFNWESLFDQYPNYVAGSGQIFITLPDGTEVSGTIAVNPLDPTILSVNWNLDGLQDTLIPSPYRTGTNNTGSPGNFDAIINPQTIGPTDSKLPALQPGRRFLIIEDIGSLDNTSGAVAWKGTDDSDLVAHANDIIEWDGTKWNIVFEASQNHDTIVYQTNIYTNVQYQWNGVSWIKSYDGDYRANQWRVVL